VRSLCTSKSQQAKDQHPPFSAGCESDREYALATRKAADVIIVETERKDLPEAYRLMFADVKSRLKSDDSREIRRIGTSVLLALATPRFSSFMLTFLSVRIMKSKTAVNWRLRLMKKP
jgi:hypothetical protein